MTHKANICSRSEMFTNVKFTLKIQRNILLENEKHCGALSSFSAVQLKGHQLKYFPIRLLYASGAHKLAKPFNISKQGLTYIFASDT